MKDIMKEFCKRKFLQKKFPELKAEINSKTNREYIYIDDLMIIVRFLGYVKFHYNRSENRNHIFIRGQSKDVHKNMLPSLFRGTEEKERLLKRLEAYKKVTEKVSKKLKAARFKKEIGGAILQHYGLKTPWLDLVDNIYIGLWFARHNMNWVKNKDEVCELEKIKRGYGWIYLLRADYEKIANAEGIHKGERTQWCDLRYAHQSLSLRPHIQHGIFIAKSDYSDENFHLNDEIVATIKFPLTLKNDIEDVKPEHMFPNKSYDNTYKYLTNPKNEINQIVENVEKEFGLDSKELGRIFTVNI